MSVGEDYPNELTRCRELVKIYEELGPVGMFGKAVIEQAIQQAEAAWASGDIVAILKAYQDMKGCE